MDFIFNEIHDAMVSRIAYLVEGKEACQRSRALTRDATSVSTGLSAGTPVAGARDRRARGSAPWQRADRRRTTRLAPRPTFPDPQTDAQAPALGPEVLCDRAESALDPRDLAR